MRGGAGGAAPDSAAGGGKPGKKKPGTPSKAGAGAGAMDMKRLQTMLEESMMKNIQLEKLVEALSATSTPEGPDDSKPAPEPESDECVG